MTDQKTIDSVKTSLYAAVGAGDVVVQAVADVVAQVRSRAEPPRVDVEERVGGAKERIAGLPDELTEGVENLRDRLAGLPSELPEELAELREKFTADELRKVAEAYLKVASDLYTSLAERGEETVERIRKQPAVEEGIGRAETAFGDAVELTEEALGTVARQTRAVGEQAAKLAGRRFGSHLRHRRGGRRGHRRRRRRGCPEGSRPGRPGRGSVEGRCRSRRRHRCRRPGSGRQGCPGQARRSRQEGCSGQGCGNSGPGSGQEGRRSGQEGCSGQEGLILHAFRPPHVRCGGRLRVDLVGWGCDSS